MDSVSFAPLAIQRLTPDDASSLGAFFEILAADPETGRFFHPHPLDRSTAEALCARKGKDRYYVVRYRGQVVAYSMLRGWDEGFAVPSFGGCTHPSLRDAGLGQALLLHALHESKAAGAPKLRLTVYKTNIRAVHVYQKLGFVFSDKNEHEYLGLYDLTRPLPTALRPPDCGRLDAWIARGAANGRAA